MTGVQTGALQIGWKFAGRWRVRIEPEPATPEIQAVFERSFDTRLARLVKLYQLKAPGVIICEALILVFKAAVLLYGEEFWRSVHGAIAGWFSVGIGICPHCHGDYRVFDICPACLDKIDKEFPDEDLVH